MPGFFDACRRNSVHPECMRLAGFACAPLLITFVGCLLASGETSRLNPPRYHRGIDPYLIDLIIDESIACDQQTTIRFNSPHYGSVCAYRTGPVLIYNRTVAAYVSAATLSGIPSLECRRPGEAYFPPSAAAVWDSWYSLQNTHPSAGTTAAFLFEHAPVFGPTDRLIDVAPFTNYSTGMILVCYAHFAGGQGYYQIVTSN